MSRNTLKARLGADTGLEAREVPAGLANLVGQAPHGALAGANTGPAVSSLMPLLTYKTELSNGTLYIRGSTFEGDRTRVSSNDSDGAVKVETEGRPAESFAGWEVKRIEFRGQGGNDRFTNDTALPSTAWGGTGNDTLLGGSATDHLYGDADQDTLDGRGGHDSLWGGAGNDDLTGGEGNDSLNGGAGNDVLGATEAWFAALFSGKPVVDDPGNDTLVGEGGNDWAFGGSGNDLLVMGADHDHAYGGTGDDSLYGGWGNDHLAGHEGNDLMDGGGGHDVGVADRPGERMRYCEAVELSGVPGEYQVYDSGRPEAPQVDGWSSGPNSASRVLRYYGFADATYAAVRGRAPRNEAVASRVGMGTSPAALLNVMRGWKADTRLVERAAHHEGLEPILRVLEGRKPVVALINKDGKYNRTDYILHTDVTPKRLHWLVVTGFNRATQTFTVVDTDGMGSREMSFSDFYDKWNFQASGLAGDYLTGRLGVKPRTFLY